MPAGFVNKKPRDVDVRHNPVGRACPKEINQPGRSGGEHGEGDRLECEIGQGECSPRGTKIPRRFCKECADRVRYCCWHVNGSSGQDYDITAMSSVRLRILRSVAQRSLLCVVRCALSVVCCLLSVVRCALSGVYRSAQGIPVSLPTSLKGREAN
jgi:hypothetical protein